MSTGEDDNGDAADAGASRAPERSESSPPPTPVRTAMLIAGGVALADTIAVAIAFRPGRSGAVLIGIIGGLYLVLGTVAVLRLRQRGEARGALRPAPGDLAFGAAVAAVMYFGATAGHLLLSAPGTPREAWIIRLYLLFGDPAESSLVVSGAVFVVAMLEELTWRGLVQRALQDGLGPIRAVLITSVLFAVAHLPTVYLLADPFAGPNPLIVLAALGCGLVWGTIAVRTRRLWPALFAHGFFSWAVVEFPVWRP